MGPGWGGHVDGAGEMGAGRPDCCELLWKGVGLFCALLAVSGSGGAWQSESAEIKSLRPRITKEHLK